MFKEIGYVKDTDMKVSVEKGKLASVYRIGYVSSPYFYEVRSIDGKEVYSRYHSTNLSGARGLKNVIDENGGFDEVKIFGRKLDFHYKPFEVVKNIVSSCNRRHYDYMKDDLIR